MQPFILVDHRGEKIKMNERVILEAWKIQISRLVTRQTREQSISLSHEGDKRSGGRDPLDLFDGVRDIKLGFPPK